MKLTVGSQQEIIESIQKQVAALLTRKPEAVLGITAVDVPAALFDALAQIPISFEKATVFNACEFTGEAAQGEQSQHARLKKLLFDKKTFSVIRDPAEGEDYDAAIRDAGGLDLVLLGLGERGHVAFDEPGAGFGDGTHVNKLADATRNALAADFGGLEQTPTHGVTMGIGTLLNAKQIILVACGSDKANAAQKTLEGRPETFIPASFLQLHTDMALYLDHDAAGKL